MDGILPGVPDAPVLVAIVLASLLLLALGVVERSRHRARLARIPLRVSVNGSRGKSTVTRLLAGALHEAGYRTLGKTTGTDPMLLVGGGGGLDEEPIARRPEGPNIGEQRDVVRRAVEEDAQILVCECMAINPEYQRTFHGALLDVNVLVICNALDDHLDEMGPTSEDVAEVFADAIPHEGLVVAIPETHLPVYERVAADREARLVVADPGAVTAADLRGHVSLVLAEHVALVLAVTRELDIPDRVALRGMRNAPADPHAMRVTPIGDPEQPSFFVNGFAVNDAASTLAVWEHVAGRDLPVDELTVVVNCRADRPMRSQLMARDVLPHLPLSTLVIAGEATQAIRRAVERGHVRAHRVLDLTGADASAVVAALEPLRRQVVFGIGNLHGGGAELSEALEDLAVDDQPTGRGVA